MVPDDSGIEKMQAKGATQEKPQGDEPGRNSVELVDWSITAGRDRALEHFPGQPLQQDYLGHHEDKYDLRRRRARPWPVHNHRAPAGRAEQWRQRTVERLEGADDPEDDRRRWCKENEQQRPQRRPHELDGTVVAPGRPACQPFSSRLFRHADFPSLQIRASQAHRHPLAIAIAC